MYVTKMDKENTVEIQDRKEQKGMNELFEYILIALACPLALLMVEPHEREDEE